jgi:hypothetical protein
MNLRTAILDLVPLQRAEIIERLADPAMVIFVENMLNTLLREGTIIERDGVLHAC